MCRQRRDLNTNHENKGNALHSRNQTSDVLFLFRYSRTFRMKISARICMWLAGGEEKRVPFACYVTLRGRMGNELSLWIETKKKKEQKREIRTKVYATPSRVLAISAANLEEFDD